MKHTLIFSTFFFFLVFNATFSQNTISGPHPYLEESFGEPGAEEMEINAALKSLSFQLLNLELGASQLERLYLVQTPFFEVIQVDLLEWTVFENQSLEQEQPVQFELLDELETLHMAMVDLEVELRDLGIQIKDLSPFDELYTADNPEVDPATLAASLDVGLVYKYQALNHSCNDFFTRQVLEELEAIAVHVLDLEAKVTVLQAAVALRKGFGGLATTESE